MVKCKFTGTVNMTAAIDETKKGRLPYEKMQEIWKNLASAIEDALRDEFECGEEFNLSVTETENEIERA